ncbi:MAG: DUF1553 domain-containing protein [Pirellulales bacterium]
MAGHLWVPQSGDFFPVHTRPPRKHKHDSHFLAGLIGLLFVTVIGLAVVVIVLDSRGTNSTAPSASPATAVAAGPASESAERRSRGSSDDALTRMWRAREAAGGSGDGSSTGDAAGGPGASTESHGSPFESSTEFDPHATLDSLVQKKLQELAIQPARQCSDAVFLRRVYLDVLGTLPTVDEARHFLDDTTPGKRARLVEHVLQRPEFADYAAMKWSDVLRVKAEFPIKLWPNAAQAYHHWIRTALHDNMRYDRFARELLTSSGSNFRTPQVNFYRAVQNREPKSLAAAVALTFLGERAEAWPTERLEGVSAFFSQVGFKPTGEWKEEIVYFDRRKGKKSLTDPLAAAFPNGTRVQIPPGQDPRRVFADWLITAENPWFARALANRVWCWLLGHGIVDPPDDVRRDNPPCNRELLNHLASELVASGYDLRQLYRLILNSQTYQLACLPAGGAADQERAERNFACYGVRRLDAEVLIDAICQVTGTTESYSSIIPEPFTFLPEGQRAVCLPDGSITSSFLEMFGRPPRDTGLESERTNRLTAAQALHLLNSNHLRNKLKQGTRLRELIQGASSPEAAADLLYLAILSRRPTDDERLVAASRCGYEDGARDVAWALINSDEFLFRH